MKNSLYAIAIVLASGTITALLAGCGGGDKKSQGSEGGACYPNMTCDSALICRSNLCVSATNTSAGGGGGNLPTVDINKCLGCGKDSCTAESDACDATNGCTDVLQCRLDCANNAACANSCNVSALDADGLSKVGEYISCVVLECASECTVTTTGGTGGAQGTGGSTGGSTGGGTSTGESCSLEGDWKGSCVTSDPQVCTDGKWTTESCAGCSITTPNNSCVRVAAITLEPGIGDDLKAGKPTSLDFAQTSSLVSAEWYLEASQMGVLDFRFASPVDATRVQLEGGTSQVEFVPMETDDGKGGCRYRVTSDGRLVRFNEVGTDDFGYPVVHWYGCWGTLASVTIGNPGDFQVINLQSPQATTNQKISMTISGLNL